MVETGPMSDPHRVPAHVHAAVRAVRNGTVTAISTPLHVGGTTIVIETDVAGAKANRTGALPGELAKCGVATPERRD